MVFWMVAKVLWLLLRCYVWLLMSFEVSHLLRQKSHTSLLDVMQKNVRQNSSLSEFIVLETFNYCNHFTSTSAD